MATIHEFATKCRRAAAGDEQAARNYERLASLHPARADEYLARAKESRDSATQWLNRVSRRLAGEAR